MKKILRAAAALVVAGCMMTTGVLAAPAFRDVPNDQGINWYVLQAADKGLVSGMGDGSFGMCLNELATAVTYKIPVTIVIFNNHALGMVRQWQELFFDRRYSFTYLANPDFGVLASAYGIRYAKISNREELGAAVEEMMAHDGPFFLEAAMTEQENVFPMIPAGKTLNDIIFE